MIENKRKKENDETNPISVVSKKKDIYCCHHYIPHIPYPPPPPPFRGRRFTTMKMNISPLLVFGCLMLSALTILIESHEYHPKHHHRRSENYSSKKKRGNFQEKTKEYIGESQSSFATERFVSAMTHGYANLQPTPSAIQCHPGSGDSKWLRTALLKTAFFITSHAIFTDIMKKDPTDRARQEALIFLGLASLTIHQYLFLYPVL